MPPIGLFVNLGVGYLIGYLFEIGPTQATSGGVGPITHVEIQTWMELIGIELQPWEVRFLRKLSYDYLDESHKAEKEDRPPPWEPQQWTQEHRDVVSKKVQSAMRSFMKRET